VTKQSQTTTEEIKRIKFDRNELAGAFGDLGTFIPLVAGMIAVVGVHPTNTFLSFGLFYLVNGLVFGAPISVQPMKAVAAISIAEKVDPLIIAGSGFFMGAFFILLTITGIIDWIDRITPKRVVRGIQLALGLRMIMLASDLMFSNYELNGFLSILSFLPMNWILTLVGIITVLLLFNNRRVPAALLILFLGVTVSVLNGFPIDIFLNGIEVNLPSLPIPSFNNIVVGTVLLAVPQIPLTIGNAVIATKSLFQTYFPEKKPISARRLSLSHGIMNFVSALFGGVPMCHGSGGLASHYRFGARTGGALMIIGSTLVVLGLFYGNVLLQLFSILPPAIIGVLLFFAGLELALSIRDIDFRYVNDAFIMLFTAALCIGVRPYGFTVGLVGGILLNYAVRRKKLRLIEGKL
jgi:MFS superfamily sulfate permease-like transporter